MLAEMYVELQSLEFLVCFCFSFLLSLYSLIPVFRVWFKNFFSFTNEGLKLVEKP